MKDEKMSTSFMWKKNGKMVQRNAHCLSTSIVWQSWTQNDAFWDDRELETHAFAILSSCRYDWRTSESMWNGIFDFGEGCRNGFLRLRNYWRLDFCFWIIPHGEQALMSRCKRGAGEEAAVGAAHSGRENGEICLLIKEGHALSCWEWTLHFWMLVEHWWHYLLTKIFRKGKATEVICFSGFLLQNSQA